MNKKTNIAKNIHFSNDEIKEIKSFVSLFEEIDGAWDNPLQLEDLHAILAISRSMKDFLKTKML